MKVCKSLLAITLTVLALVSSCFAADVTNEHTSFEQTIPTAISLSDATGTTLANAQADLVEIQAHVQPYERSTQLQNLGDVLIYDCGTQAMGDYDVSTTLYTFGTDAASPRASGQAGGISVHTYTQSGFVRFKVYFMIVFSYDGSNVSPIWNENETWTNSEDAILSCGSPIDGYDRDGTCTVFWEYEIDYGTSRIRDKEAQMSCTTDGIVTYEEKTIKITN